jgi:hypothetical protein
MTPDQQQAISNSFTRCVLFMQLSKIEFEAYKGQYPLPSLNNVLGKGINGLNGTLNDLKRVAGIQEDRIAEHYEQERLMAMSSIIQFLTNCSTEQLETIEAEFERAKNPILSEMEQNIQNALINGEGEE